MNSGSSSTYRRLRWLFLPLLLMLVFLPAQGFCDSLRNYKIKAGFTYRFILFSEWPAAAFSTNPDEFSIGIVGTSKINSFFDQVAGTLVDGRKLVIRQLSAELTAEELRGCQVVFIHESHSSQMQYILHTLEGAPVLTISDSPNFLEKGGMIAFFYQRNRIRFAVDRGHAEDVGLRFRAQMLKMATHVTEGQ